MAGIWKSMPAWAGSWRALSPAQRHAFIACFAGWTLDSFDFFLLVFCIPAISAEFHAGAPAVAEALFLTLAFRPVGALLFGALAERYGRRPTLMLNIGCYSLLQLLCAFAPSLPVLLVFELCLESPWAENGAWARLWFLKPCPRRAADCFPGFSSKATR